MEGSLPSDGDWYKTTELYRHKKLIVFVLFTDCCSPGNKHYLAEGTTWMASSAWKGESIQRPDWSYIQRSRWTLTPKLPEPQFTGMPPGTFQKTTWLETKTKENRGHKLSEPHLFLLLLFKIAVQRDSSAEVSIAAFFSVLYLNCKVTHLYN